MSGTLYLTHLVTGLAWPCLSLLGEPLRSHPGQGPGAPRAVPVSQGGVHLQTRGATSAIPEAIPALVFSVRRKGKRESPDFLKDIVRQGR